MTACDACLRRSVLIAELAGWIERAAAQSRRLPALLSLDDEQLVRAVGAQDWMHQAKDSLSTAREVRQQMAQLGLNAVCVHDDGFPPLLRHGPDACGAMFVRGAVDLLGRVASEPAVAVVGARRASSYGLEVARSLGRELAVTGVTVVSGMAFGVDAAAHQGALDATGQTVAVLATGVDVAYPARHRRLATLISEKGLLVSEFPPGFRPRRWCFPARNRIIAGMSQMTVVVEGRSDSGSLITAQFAQDLGRDLGAVPGPVTSELGRGSNQLLADGAVVVRDAQDVLDAVFGVGVRERQSTSQQELAGLDPHLRELLERVEAGQSTPEVLAGATLSARDVVARLGELELLGLIRCDESGRFIRCM